MVELEYWSILVELEYTSRVEVYWKSWRILHVGRVGGKEYTGRVGVLDYTGRVGVYW